MPGITLTHRVHRCPSRSHRRRHADSPPCARADNPHPGPGDRARETSAPATGTFVLSSAAVIHLVERVLRASAIRRSDSWSALPRRPRRCTPSAGPCSARVRLLVVRSLVCSACSCVTRCRCCQLGLPERDHHCHWVRSRGGSGLRLARGAARVVRTSRRLQQWGKARAAAESRGRRRGRSSRESSPQTLQISSYDSASLVCGWPCTLPSV